MDLKILIALTLIIISGYLDGQAFSRIPMIWQVAQENRIGQILLILLLFTIGNLFFIAASYYLHAVGMTNSLIMTLIWFVTTIIGVSLISGSYYTLPLLDKWIALIGILFVFTLYARGISQ
jgi:hypothetical protein